MRSRLYLVVFILFALNRSHLSFSQVLEPGFDKEEYAEALKISARIIVDTTYLQRMPEPEFFQKSYRSEVMGLDNVWEMWQHQEKDLAMISIRGTTANPVSWLENLYAAMVPASGELELERDFKFPYHLSANTKAAVHIGWLIGTAYLSRDMLPKVTELYNRGVKDFIIMGHSQGGGIAYLLTAHFRSLQSSGELPSDIRLKTYCSAAPKPGNLYFAYTYEDPKYAGWAFNVVNAKDWVPEVPMSIQTTLDFNEINPFINARQVIRKQKFPKNMVLKRMYNRLDKPTKKAQRNYQKYLGTMASKLIRKNILEYQAPEYYSSNHYVRTGQTIVLNPTSEYMEEFPDDPQVIFSHHFHRPYLKLLEYLP